MKLLVVSLFAALLPSTQSSCDWPTFFAESTEREKCVKDGHSVDCTTLKASTDGFVEIQCEPGDVLTGYVSYTCTDESTILPMRYQSSCVSADTLFCNPPTGGKWARNMRFLRDNYHQLEKTLMDVEYHVECMEGFMFPDGTEAKQVQGACGYSNGRSTIISNEECLPACPVKDVTSLNYGIDNLDRITIIYPTNTTRVGDGAKVFAQATCGGPYRPSPAVGTVPLFCSTKGGPTTADSGYFVESQDCASTEQGCLKCMRNCIVPDIEDGIVYDRVGTDDSSMDRLEAGSETIASGNKTAYVKCEKGFSLVGTTYISCSDGTITSEIPSCSDMTPGQVFCSAPIIENGVSSPDESYTESAEYTVACDAGYSLGDPANNKVQCTLASNEASYTTLPVCHMGCSVPDIPNGAVLNAPESLSADRPPYKTGSKAEITCNDDFVPTFGESRCDVTGWVSLTTCDDQDDQEVKDSAEGFGFSAALLFLSSFLLVL